MKYPLVSVITVNYNGKDLLKDCFDSLFAIDYPEDKLEVFMVDNGSKDDSIDFVKKNYSRVNVVKNRINNFCMANNLGIQKSNGEYIAILNNDTKVDRNWLVELIKVIREDDEIGTVGSKILFEDGRIQSVGHAEFPHYYWGDKGILESNNDERYTQIQRVQSVSNCSALYRRKVFRQVGLFDEDFGMYMEDVDMAFRAKKKGWKIYFVPDSIVYHKLHGTVQDMQEKEFYVEKNRLFLIAKHSPDKLAELMFGNGRLIRLKPVYFQNLLTELFRKLVTLYGAKKAEALFKEINQSIKKIQDYGEHCLRFENDAERIQLNQKLLTSDQQLNARQAQLNEKDQYINGLSLQIAAKDEQSKAKDEQILSLGKEITSRDQQLNAKQAQLNEKGEHINGLTLQLGVKDEQISNLGKEIVSRDQQLSVKQTQLNEKDQYINGLSIQICSKDEQLKAKDEQMLNLNKEIASRDQKLNDKQTQLKEKDQRIDGLNLHIGIKGEHIKARDEQILSLGKEIASRDQKLNDKQTQLNEKDQYIDSLTQKLEKINKDFYKIDGDLKVKQALELQESNSFKEQLSVKQNMLIEKEQYANSLNKEIFIREEQLRSKHQQIQERDQHINYLNEQIRLRDSQLNSKDALISQKTSEILNIYNSRTYRIFVKPLIWPIFEIIKKIKEKLQKLNKPLKLKKITKNKISLKQPDVCISKFSAQSMEARHMQKNEYSVRVFNKAFKEAKIVLAVDFWPHISPSHPQRHYACIAIEFNIGPRSSSAVQIFYNWENNAEFFIDNKKMDIKYFWKGPILDDRLYRIDAHLRNSENKVIDSQDILQRLEK